MTTDKENKGSRFESMCVPGSLEPADLASLDWSKLGFSVTVTPYMGGSVAGPDGVFEPCAVVKTGVLRVPPQACALNYGQSIFEGMKARRGVDGKIRLFRPDANAARFARSAERFMMPAVPQDLFIETVTKVVKANRDYIPPAEKGSLYIRPVLFGIGKTLQPAPADTTMFVVYVQPVGVYFKGMATISIKADDTFQRAAARGTGWVKAAGNYAPCFLPAYEAKHEGFSDVLYLDHDGVNVEEVGSANFAMVKGGKLYVADSPSILKGITRDSVMRIAREMLGIEVVFAPLELERVLGLGKYASEGPADEAFCTGTAAAISPIGSMKWKGQSYTFGGGAIGPITQKLFDAIDGIQTGRRPDPYGWTVVVE